MAEVGLGMACAAQFANGDPFPNPQAASPIQGGNKMGEPLASKDARLKEEG